jgi:hypothetical protein
MTNVASLPVLRLRVVGCARDADNSNALILIFNRQPTDDEMRFMHECNKRVAHRVPRTDT